MVSILYGGTSALKTDFTRTGKRSTGGAMQDGINSLKKYYLNNFSDRIRQDAFDFFVGNYIPSRKLDSPFSFQQRQSLVLLIFKISIFNVLIAGLSFSFRDLVAMKKEN